MTTHDPTATVRTWPRQLHQAERYFWLLDRLACLPIGAVGELDRIVTREELEGALAAAQARYPLLRARIEVADGQPLLGEAVGPVPVTDRKGDEASLSSDLAALLDQPLPEDGGPLASSVSLSFGTDRSAVALLIHHALMDGRGAGAVLQQVLRMVETGERANPSCAAVPPPPPLRDRLASEPRMARTARDVVSAVRAERAGLPSPDGYPFHARHVPTRRTRVHALLVEPVSRLVSAAREANATVHGLVAAAALQSAAALDGEGSKRALTLAVATPTDLRDQVEHPLADDDVMLATGLLCTPYTVAGAAPDLAGHISEQTHREFAREESQLCYRLARAGSFAATEAGLDQSASWLDAAPANIAISNPGIVSAAGDPAWVRSLSLTLRPSANQLAFVALTTYRDRLTARITTDDEKLPRPVADAFVGGLARRIGSRPAPSSEAASVDHPATGRRPIVLSADPAGAVSSPGQPLRRQ